MQRSWQFVSLLVAVLFSMTGAAAPSSAASHPAVASARDAVQAMVRSWAEPQAAIAQQLWDRPELGYLEHDSSALLQQRLREAGFDVQAGVAGMPTAFIASAGHQGSGPVIALLAEMDALPGMSQAAVPRRKALPGVKAGQACGHNLFAAAAVGAARAIAQWLRETGTDGEVRVYGTPAEEGGSGKVYMVRAGLFDDVDVVLHWHPSASNSAAQATSLANISGKFHFHGQSAHAAIAPDRGRSALDGVEALDYMANLMREHVPDGTRIHYIISHGGDAPNVVPSRASAYYYVRHRDAEVVRKVFARLQRAAQGAAMGTGTTVEFEQFGGVYGLLPNDTLGRVMDRALRSVGGIEYTPEERIFADHIQQSFEQPPALSSAGTVGPYSSDGTWMASTDVGDVSQVVPTAGLSIATWVPGTVAHSWQAVAASGMSIGYKGALHAAEVLASAAVELYLQPSRVDEARAEFERRHGEGWNYDALLERKAPALEYRLSAQD